MSLQIYALERVFMKQFISIVVMIFAFSGFTKAEQSTQSIKVQVTEKGFEPSEIKVKSGSHVVLKVTRKTDSTCATQILLKEKKIKKELPLNQEVTVDVGVVSKGDIRFACGMV